MKDEANESVSAGLSYSIEIKDAYIPPWIISSIWATMGSEGRSFEARHDKFCHCAWLFSMISPDLTTKSCSNGRRINICNWELWLSVIHLTGNHVLVNWELTKKCIYIPCCNPSSLGNEKLFSLLSFLIVPSVLPVALCFSEIDKLNPIHLINFYILTLRFELIELKVGIYQCGLF